MKPIIVAMFCAQAEILLATVYVLAVHKSPVDRPRPIGSSVAVPLFVVAIASNTIAHGHPGGVGADALDFIAAILVGMALMAGLVLLRERRGAMQRRP